MMEALNAQWIRRALASSRRRELEAVQAQIARVRHELGDLAEMLGSAAQDRFAERSLSSRAEAVRAQAADQISAGASRASDTVRQHPAGSLAIVLGIALLATLLSRR